MQAQPQRHAKSAGNRRRTVKNHRQKWTERARSKQNTSKLAVAPTTTVIGLPSIPNAIPNKVISHSNSAIVAQIALAMLDAGKIEEQDVREGTVPSEIIGHAFNRWFASLSEGMKHFDPIVTISDSLDNLLDYCEEECATNKAAFALTFKGIEHLELSDTITRIEKTVPGLGETAMLLLSGLLSSFSSSVMPDDTLNYAKHMYWMGADSESELIECDYESADEYDGPRRKDFDDAIPKMASEPEERLSNAKLKKLACSSDPEIARLASLLTKIDRHPLKGFSAVGELCEYEQTTVDPPIFCRWSENDPTYRVFDDWYQYACETGGTDCHGVWLAEITPEGISTVYDQINQAVVRMRLADQLLDMVAKPVE